MRIEGCLEKEVKLVSPLTIDKKTFSVISVREAVGADCELASVSRLRENPTEVMTGVIRSVITEVPGSSRFPTVEEIRNLPVVALENILLELSILSAGEKYEANFKCENVTDNGKKCGHSFKEEIQKSSLIEKAKVQPVGVCELSRGIHKGDKVLKTVRYRPLTGVAQENALKERTTGKFVQFTTQLLYDCIIDVDGETVDSDDIKNMTTVDRKKLAEVIQESTAESKTVLRRVCPTCGGPVVHYVNLLDFLV